MNKQAELTEGQKLEKRENLKIFILHLCQINHGAIQIAKVINSSYTLYALILNSSNNYS